MVTIWTYLGHLKIWRAKRITAIYRQWDFEIVVKTLSNEDIFPEELFKHKWVNSLMFTVAFQ